MLTEPGWDTRLQQQGFSGIDMCFRDHSTDDYSVSLMVSRALPLPVDTLPEKILLVGHEEPDEANKQLTATLLKSLTTQGVHVKTARLSQIKEFEIRDTTCVAMLEATQPFLPKISEEDFESVKHLILHSGRTLWLTNGAAINSEVPEANMMAGLGRTIRVRTQASSLLCWISIPRVPSISKVLKRPFSGSSVRVQTRRTPSGQIGNMPCATAKFTYLVSSLTLS